MGFADRWGLPPLICQLRLTCGCHNLSDHARVSLVSRSPHNGSKGNLMVYKIVVQRKDSEIDTLYWNGSLEETINLARKIGVKCEADRFRVIEFAGCGAEVRSEDAPFVSNCCARGAA